METSSNNNNEWALIAKTEGKYLVSRDNGQTWEPLERPLPLGLPRPAWWLFSAIAGLLAGFLVAQLIVYLICRL